MFFSNFFHNHHQNDRNSHHNYHCNHHYHRRNVFGYTRKTSFLTSEKKEDQSKRFFQLMSSLEVGVIFLEVWGILLESNIRAWVKLYESGQFHWDNFIPKAPLHYSTVWVTF